MAETKYLKLGLLVESDSKQVRVAQQDLEKARESALRFADALKAGVGIELARDALGSVARFPEAIKEAIAAGVEFNAELETMTNSIAGMFHQFSPDTISGFADGLAASRDLIDQMRSKANELGLDFTALLEAYKTTAGALFAGGVRDLQRQVDLTVTLTQAMRGLGIEGFQATRDIQDIFAGLADRTKAGRELGLNDADIAAAKEQGRLYDFIKEKLIGFTEAGAAGAHTFTAEMARLKNEFQQVAGEISKPVFEGLRRDFAALNAELARPEVVERLRGLGIEIASIAHTGFELTQWAVKNAETLIHLAEAAGVLGAAWAALKVAGWARDIGLATASWVADTAAIEANTAALAANAAAARRAATAGAGSAGSAVAGEVAGGATVTGAAAAAEGGGFGSAVAAGFAELVPILGAVSVALGGSVAILNWWNGRMEAIAKHQSDFNSELEREAGLRSRAFGASSGSLPDLAGDIQRQINYAKVAQSVANDGSGYYEKDQTALAERIERLQQILELAREMVATNDADLAKTEAIADAEERRARAAHDAAIQGQISDQWKKAGEEARTAFDAVADIQAKLADNLEASQTRAYQRLDAARARFSDLASTRIPGGATGQETLDELGAKAAGAVDAKSYEVMVKAWQEVAKAELEAYEAGKKVSEQNQKLTDAKRQQNEQLTEQQRKRDQLAADLKAEYDIELAKLNNQEQLAAKLSLELQIRHEIDRVQKQFPGDKELQLEVEKTAELKRQLLLRQQQNEAAKAQADVNVAIASNTGSRQRLIAAKVTQTRLGKQQELLAAGLSPEDALAGANAFGEQQDRALRREGGRIDGHARPYNPDRIRDPEEAANIARTKEFFARKAAVREAASQPFGDAVKTSAGPSGGDLNQAAADQSKSAQSLARGGDSMESAANSLKKSATDLQAAGSSVAGVASGFESAAAALSAAAATLVEQNDSLNSAIEDLQGQINDLASAIGQ